MQPRAAPRQGPPRQDARVPWFALHGPIRLSERQRRLGLIDEVQEETGLLTLMQAIAALPTRRKARPQFFDVRVLPRGADLTLGQGQAEEQTIDPRLFAQERRPPLPRAPGRGGNPRTTPRR